MDRLLCCGSVPGPSPLPCFFCLLLHCALPLNGLTCWLLGWTLLLVGLLCAPLSPTPWSLCLQHFGRHCIIWCSWQVVGNVVPQCGAWPMIPTNAGLFADALTFCIDSTPFCRIPPLLLLARGRILGCEYFNSWIPWVYLCHAPHYPICARQ